MTWNWQKANWPNFTFNSKIIAPFEREFAHTSGMFEGAIKHIAEEEKNEIIIQILTTEGVKTAEIEGEVLNRESVQSSIRRKLGLSTKKRHIDAAEAGMAELMISIYTHYNKPLTHKELHYWNKELLQGRNDLEYVGTYRKHKESMYIVSGDMNDETIHFQAPPSKDVPTHMKTFVQWFNASLHDLPPLTRSGIAHLYSVSIHPYEDGNGRMARAISEKALSQNLKHPALSGLSNAISNNKKEYYHALEKSNKTLNITDWLVYFAKTIITAQKYTLQSIERVIQKIALLKQYGSTLNERQKKVVHKLFEAEPEGFHGGLSAKNYLAITKTTRATATRDLHELVKLGILKKSGSLRYTRYTLNHNK